MLGPDIVVPPLLWCLIFKEIRKLYQSLLSLQKYTTGVNTVVVMVSVQFDFVAGATQCEVCPSVPWQHCFWSHFPSLQQLLSWHSEVHFSGVHLQLSPHLQHSFLQTGKQGLLYYHHNRSNKFSTDLYLLKDW